mgnify:CR=1 FL=1
MRDRHRAGEPEPRGQQPRLAGPLAFAQGPLGELHHQPRRAQRGQDLEHLRQEHSEEAVAPDQGEAERPDEGGQGLGAVGGHLAPADAQAMAEGHVSAHGQHEVAVFGGPLGEQAALGDRHVPALQQRSHADGQADAALRRAVGLGAVQRPLVEQQHLAGAHRHGDAGRLVKARWVCTHHEVARELVLAAEVDVGDDQAMSM